VPTCGARDILLGTRFELDLFVTTIIRLLDERLCPMKTAARRT
jgi:hypothetical protein